jgi:hypothetical protein
MLAAVNWRAPAGTGGLLATLVGDAALVAEALGQLEEALGPEAFGALLAADS